MAVVQGCAHPDPGFWLPGIEDLKDPPGKNATHAVHPVPNSATYPVANNLADFAADL